MLDDGAKWVGHGIHHIANLRLMLKVPGNQGSLVNHQIAKTQRGQNVHAGVDLESLCRVRCEDQGLHFQVRKCERGKLIEKLTKSWISQFEHENELELTGIVY